MEPKEVKTEPVQVVGPGISLEDYQSGKFSPIDVFEGCLNKWILAFGTELAGKENSGIAVLILASSIIQPLGAALPYNGKGRNNKTDFCNGFPPAVQAIAGDILEGSDSDSEPLQAADFLAGGITRGFGTNDAEDYYARLRTCHRVAFTQAYPPYFEEIPGMVRELELMESILRKAKRLEHWIEDRQSSKTES